MPSSNYEDLPASARAMVDAASLALRRADHLRQRAAAKQTSAAQDLARAAEIESEQAALLDPHFTGIDLGTISATFDGDDPAVVSWTVREA